MAFHGPNMAVISMLSLSRLHQQRLIYVHPVMVVISMMSVFLVCLDLNRAAFKLDIQPLAELLGRTI